MAYRGLSWSDMNSFMPSVDVLRRRMLGGRRCLIFAQGCWGELGDLESGVLGLKDLTVSGNTR